MKKKYTMRMSLFALFLISSTLFARDRDNDPVKQKIVVESNRFTSIADSGWSYTCKDGIEVDLLTIGLKNNVPANMAIPNVEGVAKIIVEIIYKDENPGSTIEIEDSEGNKYEAQRVAPTGGSTDVWYYKAELPATAEVIYNDTSKAVFAQSMLAYVFTYRNSGVSSSGLFTNLNGYNDIQTTSMPIPTDSGPRTVTVELPISELTDNGRYIHIEVSASDGSFAEITEQINDFGSGNCCIKNFVLTMDDVSGSVDEIDIKIDTRHKQNGMTVNGQSWILAAAIKTDVQCTCVDFDTTPPVAVNFVDHVLIEDPSELPEVTFTDECSAVSIEYNEYTNVEESCFMGMGANPWYSESNIWFHSFPFDNLHHWEEGYVQKFDDGTVKIHGRVVNNTDTTSGWIIEIYFEALVDYATWLQVGDYTPTDNMKEQRQYANVDFTKPYKIEGFGDYKDSTIDLLSTTNLHHMDIGQSEKYGGYGVGFWISYDGTVNGQAIGGENSQHIDMYASLEKCAVKRVNIIVREWTVTDAAGNTMVYVQRVEFE